MLDKLCALSIATCLVASSAAGADPDARQYLFSIHVVVVPSGEGHQLKVISDAAEKTGQGMAATAVHELRIGPVEVRCDEDGGLLFNGQPEPPPESGIEVLTSPLISAREGQKATLRSGTALEYFEPQSDGSYRLRKTTPDESPHVWLEVTATDDTTTDVVIDYLLRLTLVTGREPLPDVSLDVGKPELLTRQIETRFKLSFDSWNLISGQHVSDADHEGEDYLLILLRVQDR